MAAGATEVGGGALLAAGLATPAAAAAAITGVMATAIRTVHQPNGPWVTENGWEYPAMVIAAVLAIAEVGPGRCRSTPRSGPSARAPAGRSPRSPPASAARPLLLRDWERPAPAPEGGGEAPSAARRPAARRGRPARRR